MTVAKQRAHCWRVNTGWTGGQFGVGKRISIRHTRALLAAALSGDLLKAEYWQDPVFSFAVPTSLRWRALRDSGPGLDVAQP